MGSHIMAKLVFVLLGMTFPLALGDKKDWNLAVSFDSSDADCITSTAGKAYISGVSAMADQMPNVSLFDFDGLTIKDVQKSACPTTTSTATTVTETATTTTSSTVTSTTETATTATS